MQRVVCVFLGGNSGASLAREFAEACYRFTPRIALHGDSAVFLEISACQNLYTEESLTGRVRALARRFGFHPRVQFANDAATALSLCRLGPVPVQTLPLSTLSAFASPFAPLAENDALYDQVIHMVESLWKLGLKTLVDFLRVPASEMSVRFGELGARLHRDVARSFAGQLEDVWPTFRLTERIEERLEIWDPQDLGASASIEASLFALKTLFDRVFARLWSRGERLSAVEIELEDRSLVMAFPVPQGSTTGVLPVIRERLHFELERRPLSGPVTVVQVSVMETVPGRLSQRHLFDKTEQQEEELFALLLRLNSKLGDGSAFFAKPVDRHLPEKAWEKSATPASAKADAPVVQAQRPSRILREPVPVQWHRDSQDSQLVSMDGEQKWRISKWFGPERLSGEWWDAPFAREYYRMVATSGEELWVFAKPENELYLHGYFD